MVMKITHRSLYFNLRRDARPLATTHARELEPVEFLISISDEKPGPWRLATGKVYDCNSAAFQSQTRCQAPGDKVIEKYEKPKIEISISDEMPGPWRLHASFLSQESRQYFNLRRDARPLAT